MKHEKNRKEKKISFWKLKPQDKKEIGHVEQQDTTEIKLVQ